MIQAYYEQRQIEAMEGEMQIPNSESILGNEQLSTQEPSSS